MPETPSSGLLPDGFSGRCPICQAIVSAEPSEPAGDAPCPKCGHLIWWFKNKLSPLAGRNVSSNLQKPDERYLRDLAAESLDVVELIMEIEDEFGITISDDDYDGFRTLGDVIRFLRLHPDRL